MIRDWESAFGIGNKGSGLGDVMGMEVEIGDRDLGLQIEDLGKAELQIRDMIWNCGIRD